MATEPKIEILPAKDSSGNDFRGDRKTDGNASFLRAARAGNLEKVLEYLKGNIDINTSNANGLNALHLASKEGHVNVVTELLNRGANIDAATKKGNTALHIASLAGQEEIVKILVQHGAKVNVQSQNGFTPLYMAAQENHADVVKFLLANGASQALTTEDGFSPMAVALQQGHDKVVTVLLEHDSRSRVRLPALHIAAKKNDVKAATLLLQNEHNVDGASKSGFTPLHIAAHYGNVNVGSLLIEKGANVDFKARNNITPLHVSSKWGRTNMVNLLVDSNANISCTTRDGLTPLHCGARSGHDQVVDILLEKGAPVTCKTKNGLTPLHMAAQGDHADCARILLYHKAPIDEVTVDYLTPLHVAAHCGNVKTAKLLLDKKCQVNARALNGFTPLHIACKKNRIKVVELLLKYMANLEATTESGLTPLHVSSFMGHMNIVVLLIQHGANTDCQTVRGETALHLAARANQTDIIRILLRNGASVDAKAREEQTPLHIASRLGNVDNVVLLLQHGASPNAATKDLYTPLHIAAKEGHEEVASVLLEHGADSSLTTKKGFTPLHIAAKYGNIKVARLLIQKDADPNAQGKNGLTPLHVATHYNHPQVALLLLENKASPHAKAKNGYTPLHIAAKKNQMEIATTLLEYSADPNSESKNGFTPLHLATQEGHTDMVSLLLEHKADVNFRAKNGLAPMHLAAQEDHVPVAEILVKYDAEIDPQTKAGYTPLHTACHFGQINMIRFLLDHGASVNATTKTGYTPLHQAAQQGHVLVINLLLKYKSDPNAMTNNGQTPLSIAQRLGYISVVEVLKSVTEVTATPIGDEKYKVQSPETMQETLMTDSEDEGGDETLIGDQSYQYLSTDDMKFLHDDSISPIKDDRDLHFFERYSTASSMYGPERNSTRDSTRSSYMQEELRYTRDSSTLPRDELKYSQDTADFPTTPGAEYPPTTPGQEFPPVFERIEIKPEEEKLQSAAAPPTYATYPSKAMSEDSRGPMYGSSYSGVSFASSFDPDNIAIDRHPVYSGFLVSFMVDARGGAMRGCRHSGVRIIVPPGKACAPTRVTCKLVKREKLVYPPPLMEGEALASRVLEMGPNGAKFNGPVIIEVPHFASLRGKEREIVILRSDNGETWREHTLEATEDAIAEALNGSFEDLESAEELYQKRITRILTTDFPQYFAIVTRIRQENNTIGPEGGMLSSTVIPQVQAVFPEGALTKKIKVGLQAQPIQPETVSKLLGNRVAVSPIVTVEPRRRKFHKPITLTIPLPKASQKGMLNQYDKGGDTTPTLRLLCSITGTTAPAQWEDITGTTVLTFINDCVSFTTTVSARFWLLDCQNTQNSAKMGTELYKEAVAVPFMSKFVVFAKRHDPLEARLRVFCMTDDKMDKTLENQEHFLEVARSRDVEVQEGKPQYIEMGGNLVPVTKSGDQLCVNFHAFRENRLPFVVRIRDSNLDPVGRVAFMREPKVARGEPPQQPICNLNITLPDYVKGEGAVDAADTDELKSKYDAMRAGAPTEDTISRAELRLTDIAEALKGDWVALARQLNVSEEEILKIQSEYTYPSEQALVMLHLWVQKNGGRATGNELERGLKKIGREDVIRKCMYNVEAVTDEVEQAVARTQLDGSGFDELKEELGPSRDASLRRDVSLDVHYDEHDLMKEAESAGETGSETGSLVIEHEGDKDRVDAPHSPVREEPVAETKREPVDDDLVEKVDGIEVFGMDDRDMRRRESSSSSEDDRAIRDDKDGTPEKHKAKTKTPPPSPEDKDEMPMSPTGGITADVTAKLVEEQMISADVDRPSEALPQQQEPSPEEGKPFEDWAQQKPSDEPVVIREEIQPQQATFQQTSFEDRAQNEQLTYEERQKREQAPSAEIDADQYPTEIEIAGYMPESLTTDQKTVELAYQSEPKKSQEPQTEEFIQPSAVEPVEAYKEMAPEEYEPYVEEPVEQEQREPVPVTEIIEEDTQADVSRAPATEPEIVHDIEEGDITTKEEVHEKEETTKEGITIRTKTTIVRHVKPVKDTTLSDGQVTNIIETEELLGTEIEEDIMELPPGVNEPYGEGIECYPSVEEFEESLPDGTWERRRISRTVVKQIKQDTVLIQQKVSDLVSDAIGEALPVAARTVEPQEEEYPPDTTVDSYEEQLPDGRVVKKRVICMRVEQTVVTKTITEYPDGSISEHVTEESVSDADTVPGTFQKQQPLEDKNLQLETAVITEQIPESDIPSEKSPSIPEQSPLHSPLEQQPAEQITYKSPEQIYEDLSPTEQEPLSVESDKIIEKPKRQSPTQQIPAKEILYSPSESAKDEFYAPAQEVISVEEKQLEQPVLHSPIEQPAGETELLSPTEVSKEELTPTDETALKAEPEPEKDMVGSPIEQTPQTEVYGLPEPVQDEYLVKVPEIIHDFAEGDIITREDVAEKEENMEGITIRTKTTTITHVKPIRDTTLTDGQVTNVTETEQPIGVEIDEEIVELPSGVSDPFAENLEQSSSIQESEKSLSDGTWEKHRITKIVVKEIAESEKKFEGLQSQIESVQPEGEFDKPTEDVATEYAPAKEPEISHEIVEGDLVTNEHIEEKEETKNDGVSVRIKIRTLSHFRSIKDTTLIGGQITNVTERDEPVGIEIEEEILELPPGVSDPFGNDLEQTTSIQESEKSLPDGTWEKRKTTNTIVKQLTEPEIKQKETEAQFPVEQVSTQSPSEDKIQPDILHELQEGDVFTKEDIQEKEETTDEGITKKKKVPTATLR